MGGNKGWSQPILKKEKEKEKEKEKRSSNKKKSLEQT